MGMNEKEILSDDEIREVAGGDNAVSETQKKEFDDAWGALLMCEENLPPMKKAELFSEWVTGRCGMSAGAFLSMFLANLRAH